MEDQLDFVMGMIKTNEYCDARLESFQNVVVNSISNKVKKAFTYTKKGIGIRILSNGAWGFASTRDLSKKGLKQTFDLARKMAQVEGGRRKEPIQLA
ncbi:MAG: PmbA/TldA family metallopeptidase, partial [Candidatus Hodarchaeota archaeon]